MRSLFRQELEGNKGVQTEALGLIYPPHSPAPELYQNSVVGNGPADEWRGFRHLALILGCARRQVNEDRPLLSGRSEDRPLKSQRRERMENQRRRARQHECRERSQKSRPRSCSHLASSPLRATPP